MFELFIEYFTLGYSISETQIMSNNVFAMQATELNIGKLIIQKLFNELPSSKVFVKYLICKSWTFQYVHTYAFD